MALNNYQQIIELIEKSNNLLIVTAEKDSGDGLCSALAFARYLKKTNKPADIIAPLQDKNKFNFLNIDGQIKTAAESLKKFILSLNITHNKIRDFSYDISNDKLNIFITPEKNNFSQDDISIITDRYKYDLIFVLSSPDLESLGEIYELNADFFYQTPIINIDIDPANEHYGQINLINLNAVSVTEIIYSLIKELSPKSFDDELATCLLAGIIIRTRCFKDVRTTPKSLTLAAELIKLGAKRDLIINHLYGNKKLSTLNLWGRVMARLKNDPYFKLAWSLISQTDFIKASATVDDLKGIAEDLLLNSPNIEIAIIFYETQSGQIAAELHTTPSHNAIELARSFDPIGSSSRADFYLDTNKLLEAEELVVNYIKNRIRPEN